MNHLADTVVMAEVDAEMYEVVKDVTMVELRIGVVEVAVAVGLVEVRREMEEDPRTDSENHVRSEVVGSAVTKRGSETPSARSALGVRCLMSAGILARTEVQMRSLRKSTTAADSERKELLRLRIHEEEDSGHRWIVLLPVINILFPYYVTASPIIQVRV